MEGRIEQRNFSPPPRPFTAAHSSIGPSFLTQKPSSWVWVVLRDSSASLGPFCATHENGTHKKRWADEWGCNENWAGTDDDGLHTLYVCSMPPILLASLVSPSQHAPSSLGRGRRPSFRALPGSVGLPPLLMRSAIALPSLPRSLCPLHIFLFLLLHSFPSHFH